jgi:hypothetical protein
MPIVNWKNHIYFYKVEIRLKYLINQIYLVRLIVKYNKTK